MPLIVIMLFAGVSSILNSFSLAIRQNQDSTLSSQLLATSTYEANKYRMYANNGQRIPIIINAYDDSKANFDNIDEMAIKISSMEVQQSLRDLATKINDKTLASFNNSVI